MRMGGGPQQFGVDAEQVPALLKELADAEVDILGFHVFAGSQNLRADVLAEAQRKTVDLVLRLAENVPVAAPVPQPRRRVRHPLLREGRAAGSDPDRSQPGRAAADEDPGTAPRGSRGHRARPVHRRRVRRLRHADRRPKGVAGADFPGRGRWPAPPARRVRQLRAGDPAQLSDSDRQPDGRGGAETVTVVGKLCTPLDLLGDRVTLPPADVGDLVVVFQAGAYGFTASPTAFLSHPEPAEVLL